MLLKTDYGCARTRHDLLGSRVFCFDYDRKKNFRPDLPNDGSSDEFLLVYIC